MNFTVSLKPLTSIKLREVKNIIWVIKSRKMSWAGYVICMGEINSYRILVGKPEGKRLPGRSRHR
jgi:hypothetical protein